MLSVSVPFSSISFTNSLTFLGVSSICQDVLVDVHNVFTDLSHTGGPLTSLKDSIMPAGSQPGRQPDSQPGRQQAASQVGRLLGRQPASQAGSQQAAGLQPGRQAAAQAARQPASQEAGRQPGRPRQAGSQAATGRQGRRFLDEINWPRSFAEIPDDIIWLTSLAWDILGWVVGHVGIICAEHILIFDVGSVWLLKGTGDCQNTHRGGGNDLPVGHTPFREVCFFDFV